MNLVSSRNLCAFLMSALTLLFPSPLLADSDNLPDEIAIGGVEFVRVPAGSFYYKVETDKWHLAPDGPPIYRDVKIWLDEFFIAKYEARARDLLRFYESGQVAPEMLDRLWANESVQPIPDETAAPAFLQHHPYRRPGEDAGCTVRLRSDGRYYLRDPGRDLPTTDLTWEIADAFARWMGFRLPSEAEWQKAARGTDQRIWPWGDEYPDDTFAHFASTSHCDPVEVHAYPRGRSPYGAYNMAGNVREYVADWFNIDFDAALRDGDRNPAAAQKGTESEFYPPTRLAMGGRYSDDPKHLAIGMRGRSEPSNTVRKDGVRFALDAVVVQRYLSRRDGKGNEDNPGKNATAVR